MHQLANEPTHSNNGGKPTSLLDPAFTNAPHLFGAPAEVMPPLSTSDHLPVIIQCSITAKFNPGAVNSEYTKWQYASKDRHKMDKAFLFDNREHVFKLYNDINEIRTPMEARLFQRD